MMSPAMPASISAELALNYPYPQPTMVSVPWIPQVHAPVKLFTPQISPYISPRITHHPNSSTPNSSSSDHHHNSNNQMSIVKKKNNIRKLSKSSYKHVPHKDKPPHLVARRNARERRRVQAVNSAFARLRKCVPVENRSKRLSKVKTLHRAIEYINNLQGLLNQTGSPEDSELLHFGGHSSSHDAGMTSPEEEDDVDDEEEEEFEGERGEEREFQDLEDYLESDADVVNKENEEGQTWITLGTTCDPNYGPYINYYEDYSGSLPS